MGFELDRFESAVDLDLICKLCGKVVEEPLATPCGHVFCAACVLQWLSKVHSCPIQCQKITSSDLNHVLPLKNLIFKLDVKCDHRDRGCKKVMKLQHLSEHTDTCDFSPVRCGNEGCGAVIHLKDVASHVRETCAYRPAEICEDGCGLMLTIKEITEDHSCLQALNARNGLLQNKVMALERELKRRCLRFNMRERSLLTKLSALHYELNTTARRFQEKITEYKSRFDALANSSNKGDNTMTVKVTLHRASGSLGFNIIGGRPNEANGRNLSQGTHDHAVETFQTAEEPNEVQIRCRTAHKTQGVDSSTQTNITLKYLKHLEDKLSSPSLPLGLAVLDSYLSPTGIQRDIKSRGLDHEIDAEGVAAEDGRIQQADPIIQSLHKEDGGTTDMANMLSNRHEKDSGVSRTDDSNRNDESSEPEILGDDLSFVWDTLPGNHKKYFSQDTIGSGDLHLCNDSFLSVDNVDCEKVLDIPGMACEDLRELLELKFLLNGNSPCEYLEHDARLYRESISWDCDDLDIQMLSEELLNIELECLSIIQAHRIQTGEGLQSSNDSRTKHLTKQSVEKVHQDLINKKVDKESSSAYNTGESCWSIPPAVELSDFQNLVTEDKGKSSPKHRRNSTTATCSKHLLSPIQEATPTKSNSPSGNSEATKVEKTKQKWKNHPGKRHSPYKNTYIPAHAQHYQSYMHLIQQKSAVEYGQSQISLASLCKNPETFPSDSRPKMEWKVKIRSNGTRYITKRPTRDQLLKERALRIREERCGMTTDDDAASELKLGRYWNKEERKQHAAHAKEQRQQRELRKQCCVEGKEQAAAKKDNITPDIIQLSHKKMMKKRNKRILDNWMTIQELLTHGTRSTDGTRLYNSFLSVTTV
ncbi:E3 ubiquitin-protein ligase PDZRN3 [Paramisgurnus dabryanus]|uniref:E3 ubiquitin-protein ligase PDZRN3 n=1 Tax=Paramisgurnus dabryanus TaxID=90735 RepID=UPI003CCF4567